MQALRSSSASAAGGARPGLCGPTPRPAGAAAAANARSSRRCVAAHDAKDTKAAPSSSKSVDDVLAAANALLENLQAGTPNSAGSYKLQASIDELEQMGYVCDESGCVLVLPGDRERAAGPPPINRLLRGNNWCLGMLEHVPEPDEDELPTPFTAVVAGPCWSVPLKPNELTDFLGMLAQVRLMVANLAAQGQWRGETADRPASRVKWESNHVVMTAAWAPVEPSFSIEITFRTDRRSVSTLWPAETTAAVIAAVDQELGNAAPSGSRVEAPAAVSA